MSVSQRAQLSFPPPRLKRISVPGQEPYFRTRLGAAYLVDARQVLKALPQNSVDAIITSPPYALHFKKEYGNVEKEDYIPWFLRFAKEFQRILAEDGSLVINVGG